MSTPQSTKALIIKGKSHEISEVPIATVQDDEILFKASVVAINPTDANHLDNGWSIDGAIVGCDAAGEVLAVGKDVTDFKVGDLVASMLAGSSVMNPLKGAFAEYVVAKARVSYKFPSIQKSSAELHGHVAAGPVTTLEQAVSVPVGITTAIVGLGWVAGLDELKPNPEFKNQVVLVWGGASAVGQSLVQVAKYMGFTVFSTNSARNNDWVKEVGADKCFDYNDENVVDQIKKAAGDNITYAFDSITKGDTTVLSNRVVSRTKPAAIFTMRPFNPDTLGAEKLDNVKYHFPNVYLGIEKVKKFGVNHEGYPSPPGLWDTVAKMARQFNEINASNRNIFKAMPLRVLDERGFDAIIKGIDILRKGQNSGEKIVIHL
jgi:NADPH:quinone reductase-like Zn-dependent oxidoreductase